MIQLSDIEENDNKIKEINERNENNIKKGKNEIDEDID